MMSQCSSAMYERFFQAKQ